MIGWQLVDAQFILSIIAILFYSYILYLMSTSKSKTMKAAFFRIFVFTGFCDILGILALEWCRAEMKTSFGPSFEVLTRVAMTVTGINFFTHIIGCLLMTVNRFTAVCFPHIQHRIWRIRDVCALLIFDVIISIGIHTEALIINFVYEPSPDGGWIIVGRSRSLNRLRIIVSILPLFYEVASIMLITYTIYVINKQLRDGGHRLSQDMSLVFVTAISCVMSIFECVYDVSFLLRFENPVILWIKDQYDINFFLVMTTNAFAIFFLSRSLRQEFLTRWCPTKVQIVHTMIRTRDVTTAVLK